MPWQYSQSSGQLKHDGVLVDTGYSGIGIGKNNPDTENKKNTGPIPRGTWSMGQAYASNKGKFTIPLKPVNHSAHKRTAFLIHGDSIANPGTASHGCIILPLQTRKVLSDSNDKILNVVR